MRLQHIDAGLRMAWDEHNGHIFIIVGMPHISSLLPQSTILHISSDWMRGCAPTTMLSNATME